MFLLFTTCSLALFYLCQSKLLINSQQRRWLVARAWLSLHQHTVHDPAAAVFHPVGERALTRLDGRPVVEERKQGSLLGQMKGQRQLTWSPAISVQNCG